MYSNDGAFAGVAILFIFVLAAGLLVLGILYLVALQKALDAVSDENRKMPSGQVWLLLIPLFNMVWAFIVVARIADSFRDEFSRLNIDYNEPRPTYNIGLAKCILSVCGIVPFLGYLASFASLICWIIYWVKVNECRKLIEANQNNMMLDAERGVFHSNSQGDQLKGW
jgi:hypothetical protein